MKCPSCGEEMEPTQQDPDFSRSELKGTTAVLDVTKNLLCEKCFEVVESNVFRLKVELPEVAEHIDPEHTLNIHPDTIEPLNGDGYEVAYSINCSCGELNFSKTGIAAPREKAAPATPWANQ